MTQATINFTSPSPINTDRMTGQNKALYDFLLTGKPIHCFSQDRINLGIGYLNSRISDLVKAGVEIKKERIQVPDVKGEMVTVVKYWI